MSRSLRLPNHQTAIRAKCFHPSGRFEEFRREDIEQSIPGRFENIVDRYPDRIAVKTHGYAFTYDMLNRAANRVARAILARRGQGNEPVTLLLRQGISSITAILGALKAGKIYVSLDPTHPGARIRYILEETQASLIVSDNPNFSRAKDLARNGSPLLNIDRIDQGLLCDNVGLSIPADSLAYIMYTSGSTGQPKGVVQNHRNLISLIRSYTNGFHISVDDRLTLLHSCSFNGSVYNLLGALLNGAALLPFDLKAEGVDRLGKWLARAEITIYHSSPTAFCHAVQTLTGEERFPHLRVIHLSGAPVSSREAELYKKCFSIDCVFVHRMGVTETGTIRWYFMDKATPIDGTRLPIGYPVDHNEVLLLDESGHDVGHDRVGEIAVRGRYLSLGYWQKPQLTLARFFSDPDGGDQKIYRTGDLGLMTPDGCLFHLGRKDFQVKVRGYRVELSEIEKALLEHGAIKEAAVIGREMQSGDRRLVAYFVPRGRATATVSELRKFLEDRLPDYMIPSAFVMLPALPLTPNGRVDHLALPDPDGTRPELDTPFAAPGTPVEEDLAAIWAELLSLDRIGIHDHFLDLGGHSLLAAQIVSRIRGAFGREISLRTLFEAPTVAELAVRLATACANAPGPAGLPIQPEADEDAYPLSFAQERFWFLEQLEPGNPAYRISYAFRLIGPLNVDALERSLAEIVRRHEPLRTTIQARDEKPVQVIARRWSFRMSVVEPPRQAAVDRDGEIQRLIEHEYRRPFVLSTDLLLRATLLRLGPDENVLLLNSHHIAWDHWCLELLVRELSALYGSFAAGQPSPLPELPVQYKHHALWQRKAFPAAEMERHLAYWKRQLRGGPPSLNLPVDYPRKPLRARRGGRQTLLLPKSLSRDLLALSRRGGVTPFMTLLAAYQTLLYRMTGQDDIVVGTPIAARDSRETEGLIGLFLNSLALRTDLSGNPPFLELLRRVREVTLGAYDHRELPFEKLVEELQPERDLTQTPICQVFINMYNFKEAELELDSLSVKPIKTPGRPPQFDIEFFIREDNDGIHLTFAYDSDLFDAATIARTLGHLQVLLQAIVSDPERRLGDLPILTDTEEHQLLVHWNDTRHDWSNDKCIHELFAAQAERTPHALALISKDAQLTYGELNARANQLAHYLRNFGVGPEVPVGICMERSAEMVIGLLGILKAGGAYVPLDPEYPQERLAHMIEDSGVSTLVTQESLVERPASDGATIVCLDTDWPAIAHQIENNPAVGVTAENLAYIIFTSGSTGRPKGAMNTHGGIRNRLLWMQRAYHLETADRVLQKTPFSFDVSVWEFFWPLITGACLSLVLPRGHKDSAYLAKIITEQKITTAHFVPSMLKAFLEEDSTLESCSSLARVICSGEALSVELKDRFLARFNAELHNLYGPTEAAVDVTSWDCRREPTARAVPIGRPIANTRIYLLDAHLQPVPIGVTGELHIGGAGLARGYANRPDLTAESFIPDPFSHEPGARLYKTGDLARYRSDGNIEFLGRIDHQVKIRGFRIELGEVEAALIQHPAVRQAVVLAREEEAGDKRLVGYAVCRGHQTATATELREFLRSKLPEHMVPSAFVTLDTLPLTANGKLDLKALPAPQASRSELQGTFVPPRNLVEKTLAALWAHVLKLDRVGVHDDFFELGGHSLLATRIVSRACEAFRVELPLRTLFENPTVAGLALQIAQAQTRGTDAEGVVDVLSELESLSDEEARRLLVRGQSRST